MLFLVTASLIWAFSFGLIKSFAGGIDPFVLGTARTGIAALFFLPWFTGKRSFQLSRQIMIKAMICGFLQIGLMYGPYLLSFRYLKSHEVALFTMTTPVWMALIIATEKRRLTWTMILAAALATAGGVIAAGGATTPDPAVFGIILVQISNILFSLGLVLWTRWIEPADHSQSALMFPFFLGAFVASTFLALILATDIKPFTSQEALIAIYLGVFASGLGFFLWNKGALRVGPVVLGAANNIKLPIAVLVSLTVFGESTNLINLSVGGVLILFAIWIASKRDRFSSMG